MIIQLIQMANAIMLIMVCYRYKQLHNDFRRFGDKYSELVDDYYKLKNAYQDLLLQKEAIIQIYKGCRSAERKTGAQVDFDGDVQIIRRSDGTINQ